jgi:drug/metabolite transporter (DMT)-like permease
LLLTEGPTPGLAADRQSHIGRAIETLQQGRLDVIGATIMRKLKMNGHLIMVSAWSKVLLTGILVMAVLVLRPRGRFRRWQQRYPYLMYGCAANVIGAIAALLLNDSGIVAAATMIVYGSVPLLLLKLEEV